MCNIVGNNMIARYLCKVFVSQKLSHAYRKAFRMLRRRRAQAAVGVRLCDRLCDRLSERRQAANRKPQHQVQAQVQAQAHTYMYIYIYL